MKRLLFLATILSGLGVSTGSAVGAWETHTDRPGMNLRSFPISADTELFEAVKRCEDACHQDPKCRSFTYVNPGIQGPKGQCHLKKGVPAGVKNKHCTSGVVRPTSKASYCDAYAKTAVERAKANRNWKCGYTGNMWSEKLSIHRNWCMKVPVAKSKGDADERQRLMKTCLAPASTGDLSAHDWCYRIHPVEGRIEFRPVIKNAQTRPWQMTKAGYYKVGVTSPGGMTQTKFNLPAFPQWSLNPRGVELLDGLSLSYHADDMYQFRDLWTLSHPSDGELTNNRHPGADGYFKGKDFASNPTLARHRCQFYVERNTWSATPAPKKLEVHIDIDTIEVIDEKDGSGTAEPYLWTLFFEIDDQVLSLEHFYKPENWIHAPGGSHENIGKSFYAGDVRLIPAKYGHWKTILTMNPISFPKRNAHVGVVVVLLEEDDLPTSSSVDSEHYPYFRDIVRKRLQCTVLKSLKAELATGKKAPAKAALQLVFDRLKSDPRAKALDCPEVTGALVLAGQSSTGPSSFEKAVAAAERELEEIIVGKLQDPIPWFLRFIPELAVVSAAMNLDDYIGSKVLLWSWEKLEKDPFRSQVLSWSSGSEDGHFDLRVHVKAYPVN